MLHGWTFTHSPAFRRFYLLQSLPTCFILKDRGHSMFKSKRRLILFQEHSKSEYFHDVQKSTFWRLEWHWLWSAHFSRQVDGLYKQVMFCLLSAKRRLKFGSTIDIKQKSHAILNSAPLKFMDWFASRPRPSAKYSSTHCRNSLKMITCCMQGCK